MFEFALQEKYHGEESYDYYENLIDTIHTLAQQGFMEDAERLNGHYIRATRKGQ